MTRHESDKEDLIADAVALIDRAEYSMASEDSQPHCIVTVGFRSDRSLSVYFDQDPFYQFDSAGLLRRSFANNFLYRSQGTTLARLQRERSDGAVSLMRTDLTPYELHEFGNRMTQQLTLLKAAILSGAAQRLRTVTDLPDFDTVLIQQIDVVLGHQVDFLSTSINHRK